MLRFFWQIVTFKKVGNWLCNLVICCRSYYSCPSFGEAYRDLQLTPNFELWVEIFCVLTCFHMRILKPCLSIPQEKKSPWLCQYQSYISIWYINGKVFTNTTAWKPKKKFFSKSLKLNFDLCRNHLSFVSSISPTLVIDGPMERSSQVPTTAWELGNPKIWFH